MIVSLTLFLQVFIFVSLFSSQFIIQGMVSLYELCNTQTNDTKNTLLKFQRQVHLFGNTRSKDAALCT